MSADPDLLIERIRDAARQHDGQDPLDEAAVLDLKERGAEGLGVVLDPSGDGFALVRGGQLDLAVHPAHRREGVGASLVADVLASTEVASAWSHGDHPAAARLAQRHGFEARRALWVMRRRPGPLPSLEVGEGIEIRGFREDDLDAVLAVNAEAFASHPEQGRMDRADFRRRAAEDWFDPAGLLVAVDTTSGPGAGNILGFHWTKRHDDTTGEVYVVGVASAAQGRGLGRSLTLAGLHHLGETSDVLLYVESDNHAALKVYSGLGFGHDAHDTHVQYLRA